MIIYLCMKYESNTPMFSKDIARKPFFVRTDVRTRVMLYAPPPIINGGGIKMPLNKQIDFKLQSNEHFMKYKVLKKPSNYKTNY